MLSRALPLCASRLVYCALLSGPNPDLPPPGGGAPSAALLSPSLFTRSVLVSDALSGALLDMPRLGFRSELEKQFPIQLVHTVHRAPEGVEEDVAGLTRS